MCVVRSGCDEEAILNSGGQVVPTSFKDGIFTSYFPTPLEKDPRVQIETFPWPVRLGFAMGSS